MRRLIIISALFVCSIAVYGPSQCFHSLEDELFFGKHMKQKTTRTEKSSDVYSSYITYYNAVPTVTGSTYAGVTEGFIVAGTEALIEGFLQKMVV